MMWSAAWTCPSGVTNWLPWREAFAQRPHARQHRGPLVLAGGTEHLDEAAVAEAQPLHQHELVAGARIAALRDDLVAELAADPDWAGIDDLHVRTTREGRQCAQCEAITLGG